MHLRKTLVLITLLFAGISTAFSQKVGVKTNLLTDVAATPNLGVECALADHWTLELDGQIIAWTIKDHSWKHWMVSPEARWWFCEKFNGSFFGLNLMGGQFNVGNIHNSIKFLGQDISQLSDYRFQGWYAGAGINYGYAWEIANHWNIEAEIGIGYAYMKYDRYRLNCNCDDNPLKNKQHNYWGLTKLALNLEYLF